MLHFALLELWNIDFFAFGILESENDLSLREFV
jgi:hypothetical protein